MMKNLIINICRVSLIIFVLFVSSCSNEQLSNDESKLQLKSDPEIQYTLTVTGKLHRGARWSARNNVAPCSTSFGLCGLGISISASVKPKSTDFDEGYNLITFQTTEIENNLKLIFEEPLESSQAGTFMSEDDDDFIMSEEFASDLGYSQITIIAKNYGVQYSEEHPNGYVILTVINE